MLEVNAVALGPVGLTVTDLDRSRRFWEGGLQLESLSTGSDRAMLGAGGRPLVELVERPRAARDPSAAGLFHVALLLPDRAALGRALGRLTEQGLRLTGRADHRVSEALYLDDPDGHGVELYADRPRETWHVDGRLVIVNKPLDLDELLTAGRQAPTQPALPPGTTVGHVHLEPHDLDLARSFYTSELGLAVTADGPRAVFMSWAGYHHHVAANIWRGRARPLDAQADNLALRYLTLRVPDEAERERLLASSPAASDADGERVLLDPSGIPIRVIVDAKAD